jgi:hypothetical protein
MREDFVIVATCMELMNSMLIKPTMVDPLAEWPHLFEVE